jgi:hypothetical protein
MESLVGFVASAGLFGVSHYFACKQNVREQHLLTNLSDLSKPGSSWEEHTNSIGFVTPQKSVHILTLRQQTLQHRTTLVAAPVVRLDRVLSNDAEKRAKAVDVQLQEKVKSELVFANKTKFLTDESFGFGRDKICASDDFRNSHHPKKFGGFPVQSECIYDGMHMRHHLFDSYDVSTQLIPSNLYEAKARNLTGRPVYLWGQRFNDQFQYTRIASNPNQLIALNHSHLPDVGRVCGFLGMFVSAGSGIASRL